MTVNPVTFSILLHNLLLSCTKGMKYFSNCSWEINKTLTIMHKNKTKSRKGQKLASRVPNEDNLSQPRSNNVGFF